MINVYVISGFLGSGKTTFIQKLLNEKKFKKVMLLENEFGEVGVDSAFFDSKLQVKEVNNGCICCSLKGDFETALEEIESYEISDLIIEPSGVGKLSEIIKVVAEDDDFRIISHICIVDVKTCQKYHKNFKEYFDDQVNSANTIVLSHLDVAEDGQKEEAIKLIKEINDEANITLKPINDYPIEELMDEIVKGGEVLSEFGDDECECHHHHHEEGECCHHHHHREEGECCHHHHNDEDEDEVFKNVVFRPEYVFTKDEIGDILSNMDEDIIRVKGYVKSNEGTLYFNYILNEYHMYIGEERNDSLVCIIATTLNKEALKEVFHG